MQTFPSISCQSFSCVALCVFCIIIGTADLYSSFSSSFGQSGKFKVLHIIYRTKTLTLLSLGIQTGIHGAPLPLAIFSFLPFNTFDHTPSKVHAL